MHNKALSVPHTHLALCSLLMDQLLVFGQWST